MSQTVSKQDMMQGSRTLVQTEPWLLNNENIGRKTDTATCLLARDYKGYGKMQLGNGVVEQWRKSQVAFIVTTARYSSFDEEYV